MPVVRISEALYRRLQRHATPFVDTPANVIERLLDSYELHPPLTDCEMTSDGPEVVASSDTDTDVRQDCAAGSDVKQRRQRRSQRPPRTIQGKVK